MKKLSHIVLMLMTAISGNAWASSHANDPLIVIATVKVQAGYEEQFKQAAMRILAPTHEEAGSISYQFNQSPNDPTEFSTIEVWRSQADIDQHMTLRHMQEFFATVGPMFAPGFPILKTYTVIKE